MIVLSTTFAGGETGKLNHVSFGCVCLCREHIEPGLRFRRQTEAPAGEEPRERFRCFEIIDRTDPYLGVCGICLSGISSILSLVGARLGFIGAILCVLRIL